MANGISFCTFANSRADVTKPHRPWHAGRCELRVKQDSEARAGLEAYIRDLRGTMEGPKGGSTTKDKYHIPKESISKRWATYVEHRRSKSLPIHGSESLFGKLWAQHKEIREFGAKGHPKCDKCSEIQADRQKYTGREDKLQELEEKQSRCACGRGR